MDRTRRSLIAGLAAAALPLPQALAGAGPPHRLYLSARAGAGASFAVSILTASGELVSDIPLPARGHGGAIRPDGRHAVLFARRPGGYALVLDLPAGEVAHRLKPGQGFRFAGHGAYSADGKQLFAIAFKAATAEGVILAFDVEAGYRRAAATFPTGGIGPHQALLLPGGGTLAVCNGGIRTHPDYPRAKLNIADMRASLALIDAGSGRIEQKLEFNGFDHRLSIRHMDAAGDGRIVVGMQYEGPRSDRVPLAALSVRGGDLVPLPQPADADMAPRHYVGSIAFDSSGAWIAATSPRGGSVAVWRSADLSYRGHVALADVSGIAAGPRAGAFVVTSGRGVVAALDARTMTLDSRRSGTPGVRWDNHLVAIVGA